MEEVKTSKARIMAQRDFIRPNVKQKSLKDIESLKLLYGMFMNAKNMVKTNQDIFGEQ